MKIEVVVALVGVVGVVLGAIAQFVFTKRTEATKHFQELRSTAYTDFIKGTAGIAISQRLRADESEREFTILLADAKARIAVYGAPQVVSAMSAFFRHHSSLDSPAALNAFISIVQEMRHDTLAVNQRVLDKEISQVLFGVE